MLNTDKSIVIAFFVFLTLSIGIVSTNSVSKFVYAQSNVLGQIGGGNAYEDIEQVQTPNQDNQVVSGDSSILSGNNLQCQDQDNSDISDEDCNSGVVNIPNRGAPLDLIINTNEQRPQYTIIIDQFNRDEDFIGGSSESITNSTYLFSKELDPRTDSVKLYIEGLPKDKIVTTTVSNFGGIPIRCNGPEDDGTIRCDANGLYNSLREVDSLIFIRVYS